LNEFASGDASKAKHTWKKRALSGLILALVIAVTVAIIVLREKLQNLGGYGYAGVFLISLMGNATVVLPAPSLAIVFAMGSVLSPLLVGVVAGVGEALGELTGYLAGVGGRFIVEDYRAYERVRGWMERYGALVVFILSVIPNPFFDLAGIVAGASRFPLWLFLTSCWVGKTIKTAAVALAGYYSIEFIQRFL